MIHLNISGMTCKHCTDTVSKSLHSVDGVENVSVSLDPGTASVIASVNVKTSSLIDAIQAKGFEASVKPTAGSSDFTATMDSKSRRVQATQ